MIAVSFLKKLFGGSKDVVEKKTEPVQDPVQFVTYVVRSLVDSPDKVSVTTKANKDSTVIQIACEKSDISKVIGKSGKTIGAIRSLVQASAAQPEDRNIRVEVPD